MKSYIKTVFSRISYQRWPLNISPHSFPRSLLQRYIVLIFLFFLLSLFFLFAFFFLFRIFFWFFIFPDDQTYSSILHGNHPRTDSEHWTIYSTREVPLHSLFFIPLLGCIIYSNLTLPLQARNYRCRTHTLHTSGTYPSRCWVAWIITPPPPLVNDNGYLNHLQI